MSNRSIIGLLLIVLGAAFILNNYFDIFDSFGSWWPLLLILIGLVQLLKRASSVFGGLLLIAVGLLFLGKNLNFIPGRLIFPLILICIGLFFIFSRIGGTRQENADYIRYFTLFSGLETNNQSQNFKGGSVAAVFGGIGLIPGAMIGGYIIGATEVFVAGYGRSMYKDAVVFAILILILLVKPSGLLGRDKKEKV